MTRRHRSPFRGIVYGLVAVTPLWALVALLLARLVGR